jgi:hypothetical protein
MKPGTLTHLFNVELVDFVRQDANGDFHAVEWPKDATHELRGTSWNNIKLYKPNGHGKIQMPVGYALSVCAVPMHRKRTMRGPMIKVRAALPETCSAYNGEGSLNGKRAVLLEMIALQRAVVKKTFIKKATSEQCDTLYRNLKVADFYLE